MTDDEEPQIQIPADSVTILDLLLRAGLCAPHLWDDMLTGLPDVERAETRDALSQGGWPLPQLTWEWGATVGEIDPLQSGSQDITLTQFYESLDALSGIFLLQISVPIVGDVHDDVEPMRPFAGQRLHLVNRSDWMSFGPPPDDLPSDLDDVDIPPGLPVLTDPAIAVGERRAGEVWIRLHPEQIAALKQAPEELFNLLIWVADTRLRQLRETLRRRQSSLTEDDISTLAANVERVSSWQRLLHAAIQTLDELAPEKRAEKLPGVLEITTGHWEFTDATARDVQPLTVFLSYSRGSESHNAWVVRLADALEGMREFEVIFDAYEMYAGKDLIHFMDRAGAADRVVVVITPEYVRKAETRIGGVGYESSVISAALLQNQLAGRYVPVLREGVDAPPFLRSKLYVDFRDDDRFMSALAQLRSALLGRAPLSRPTKKR